MISKNTKSCILYFYFFLNPKTEKEAQRVYWEMADTNEGVPYVEIIKSFKQKLHDAPTPFLDSDNKEVWPDEKSSLKNRKIVPLTDNSPLITVFGPKIVCYLTFFFFFFFKKNKLISLLFFF